MITMRMGLLTGRLLVVADSVQYGLAHIENSRNPKTSRFSKSSPMPSRILQQPFLICIFRRISKAAFEVIVDYPLVGWYCDSGSADCFNNSRSAIVNDVACDNLKTCCFPLACILPLPQALHLSSIFRLFTGTNAECRCSLLTFSSLAFEHFLLLRASFSAHRPSSRTLITAMM